MVAAKVYPGGVVDSKQASNLTTGLVLVVIGLILFVDEINLIPTWNMGRLWPMILLAVGAGNLLRPEKRGFGVWMLFVGALFLLHTHRLILLRDSWPLFVVAFGLALVIGAWSGPVAKKEG
jgi:hypothetical protein